MHHDLLQVQDSFSLGRSYTLFRTMGLHHVLVTDRHNRLAGIISRQDLLEHQLLSALHEEVGACTLATAAGTPGGPSTPPAAAAPGPGTARHTGVLGDAAAAGLQVPPDYYMRLHGMRQLSTVVAPRLQSSRLPHWLEFANVADGRTGGTDDLPTVLRSASSVSALRGARGAQGSTVRQRVRSATAAGTAGGAGSGGGPAGSWLGAWGTRARQQHSMAFASTPLLEEDTDFDPEALYPTGLQGRPVRTVGPTPTLPPAAGGSSNGRTRILQPQATQPGTAHYSATDDHPSAAHAAEHSHHHGLPVIPAAAATRLGRAMLEAALGSFVVEARSSAGHGGVVVWQQAVVVEQSLEQLGQAQPRESQG